MDERDVVLTGAAGRIGGYLREVDGGLAARGWRLRLLDVETPDPSPSPDETFTAVDLTSPGSQDDLEQALRGAAAVVHLAGIPHEDTWEAIRTVNVDGTYRVLEAARRAGVRRVVLASSNHAVGFYPTDREAPTDRPPRPDSLYGVSKVTAEALGSLYADKDGLEVVALRIGLCAPRPATEFDLGTWLSPGDAVRLVDAALRGPVQGATTVYGISRNTRRWWDLGTAEALGYAPQDDAEAFADEVAPDDGPHGVLGHDFTAVVPPDRGPRRPDGG